MQNSHAVVRRAEYSFIGVAMAVTLFCLSLTPSLLPRDWLLQGIVSGVLTVIGYGIGALLGLAVRRLFPHSNPAIKRVAWWALAVWGPVVVAAFLYLWDPAGSETFACSWAPRSRPGIAMSSSCWSACWSWPQRSKALGCSVA